MKSEIITARVRPYGTKAKLIKLAKKLGFDSLNQYLEDLYLKQLKQK